jgi:polyhydroxyalkanoate synthesis regulator phasin
VPLKQQFLNKALTLLQDPRVSKLLQDPRVMSGIVGAMKLQSDVKRSVEARVQRVVKSLHLASESEVQELQRAVARLERELERTRNQRREPPEGRTVS